MMTIDPSRYFTSEQRKYLSQRQHEIGYERTLEILKEWEEALVQFRVSFDQGTSPTDVKLIPLAKHILSNSRELLGENSDINDTFEKSKKKIVEDTAATDIKQSELMHYVFLAIESAAALH